VPTIDKSLPRNDDHVNIPLPMPPYTMQYPRLLKAATASHDGIDLLVNVGNFPPTPRVPNTTNNYHVPTDDVASNSHVFSSLLLLLFLGVTAVVIR